MSHDINAVRDALFDTLKMLKEGTIDLDRAHAINETAQGLINTAKVEVDFMRVAGGRGTGFIPEQGNGSVGALPDGTKVVAQFPAGTVTQHRVRG